MKKGIIISMVTIGIIFILSGCIYQKDLKRKVQLNTRSLIKEIKNHYYPYVITTKDSNLYYKKNKKYIKNGIVSKNVELTLEKTDINKKTKYFKIKNTNNYISYKNVKRIEFLSKNDLRFKKYLYFNESIQTKNKFTLYTKGEKIYTFYEPMKFKVLIKDDNQYGVIYQGKLYYLKKDEVEKEINENNNNQEIASEIPVTVYHFLYLENEECNEIICNSINQVNEEFNYLKQNNYFTINTKEMEYFIKGKINLPKNSILITIDDGAKATNFLSILEKYQINATLFLVSSWYSKDDFKSSYLEISSHTHNLHNPGICNGGQGSPLRCMNKEELLIDLQESRRTLNQTEAFCFPFYEYNDYAIEIIKEAGFKTAYIGTDQKASIGINPYTIPRITIHNNISLEQYVNLIK